MYSLTPKLSTINSEEYKIWKSETLAKQTYQLEPVQTTGIWHHSKVRSTHQTEVHFGFQVRVYMRGSGQRQIHHRGRSWVQVKSRYFII